MSLFELGNLYPRLLSRVLIPKHRHNRYLSIPPNQGVDSIARQADYHTWFRTSSLFPMADATPPLPTSRPNDSRLYQPPVAIAVCLAGDAFCFLQAYGNTGESPQAAMPQVAMMVGAMHAVPGNWDDATHSGYSPTGYTPTISALPVAVGAQVEDSPTSDEEQSHSAVENPMLGAMPMLKSHRHGYAPTLFRSGNWRLSASTAEGKPGRPRNQPIIWGTSDAGHHEFKRPMQMLVIQTRKSTR